MNNETSLDVESLRNRFLEMAKNAKEPTCPDFLMDERLEDAFKEPVRDEDGCVAPLPAIYNEYGYGKYRDGVKFLTLKSASLQTNLYSKYLDDQALVWDSEKEELFLYVPDPAGPNVAFKGSRWQFAKRLKPEFEDHITLRDVYYEIMGYV